MPVDPMDVLVNGVEPDPRSQPHLHRYWAREMMKLREQEMPGRDLLPASSQGVPADPSKQESKEPSK
jgi:hypothetical protein